jgi:DNA-directed RNA polymerase specialized sigma24 family protein
MPPTRVPDTPTARQSGFADEWSLVRGHAALTFLRTQGRRLDAWSVGNADAQESLDQVAEEMVHDLCTICEEERARMEEARSRVEARLDENTRQAFRLLVDDGYSAEEVAGRLGMSKVSVWQVRSRVLRKIRQELREDDAATNE